MTSKDFEDEKYDPPSAERVLKRAFCLAAVVGRAYIDEAPTEEERASLMSRVATWLKAINIESEIESWEETFIYKPLGELSYEKRAQGSWLSEDLAVLAWALNLYELPPHDVTLDASELTNRLHFLQPTAIATGQIVIITPSMGKSEFYRQRPTIGIFRDQIGIPPE